jgi:hypothetical protein
MEEWVYSLKGRAVAYGEGSSLPSHPSYVRLKKGNDEESARN